MHLIMFITYMGILRIGDMCTDTGTCPVSSYCTDIHVGTGADQTQVTRNAVFNHERCVCTYVGIVYVYVVCSEAYVCPLVLVWYTNV